ncbi:general substrate transporter [Hyaloscypha variabilis]|uniref:General substrate transporter n=1 Tax=Hyaloscypha variabilis (strain UAMH 11265 / GT02V1 / F) TaxID=1149755 RepID=A0A2J6SE08_HYAVF|nr:general substrate transporter [Hyaloscypha variabilis F]
MPLYGQNMVYAISLVAGLGIVFEGYDQGVMSGVNISPSYIDLMQIGDGATGTITNPNKQGGLVAIYYLGTLLGALMGGWVSDKIGRNKTIIFASFWGLLGSSLQVAAQNSNWMLCARILAGVGTGGISAVIPVWSSELVAHDSRGAVIAFEMVVNYAGISSAYWLEYVLAFINGGNTSFRWRFPLGFQMIPLLVLMIMMLYMPESPRFDIGNGNRERGRKTLAIMRAAGDIDHPDVIAEYEEIIAAVELEAEFPARGFFNMVTGHKTGQLHLGRRTFLAAWLQIMQAWTGVTTVVVYAPTLFRIAGFGEHKANLLTGCCNLVAMVSCVLAIFTIDRFGRRKVLMVGGAGQSLAMFLLGALSKVGADQRSASIGAAAGSFVFVYNFVFASTWLSVPWVYPTEIFPLAIRAKGNAFGIVGWSIGCGSVSLAAPNMFQGLGPSTFYIHAVFNLFAILIVYCFYPETSCRTLEEIDLLFASNTLWVWDTEKRFQELKLEHSDLVHGVDHHRGGKDNRAIELVEDVSDENTVQESI